MTVNNGQVQLYCSCGGDEASLGITATLNYNTANGQIVDVAGAALTIVNQCSVPGRGHVEGPTGNVIFDGPVPVGTTSLTRQQMNSAGVNNRSDYRAFWIANG
jgi:hypothetical protein